MYTLINYVGFINYLFYGVTVAGQIVLRIKQPDMHRPIKVCLCGALLSIFTQCVLHFVVVLLLIRINYPFYKINVFFSLLLGQPYMAGYLPNLLGVPPHLLPLL